MAWPKVFLSILMLMGVYTAFSQTGAGVVSGRVIDKKTKQPVEFAVVRYKGSTEGVATDSSGTFHLTGVATSGIIEVSFLGYKPLEYTLIAGRPRDYYWNWLLIMWN